MCDRALHHQALRGPRGSICDALVSIGFVGAQARPDRSVYLSLIDIDVRIVYPSEKDKQKWQVNMTTRQPCNRLPPLVTS